MLANKGANQLLPLVELSEPTEDLKPLIFADSIGVALPRIETMESDPKLVAEPLPVIVQRKSKAHSTLRGEPWSDEDEAAFNPASQPIFRYRYMDDLYLYINKAIGYYNSNHQNDMFELVDPLYMRFNRSSDWCSGQFFCHLAFIAKSKKSSSKAKLFFAEINADRLVSICSVADPGNPLVEIGCGDCHGDGVIYHPYVKSDWSNIHEGYYGKLCGIEKRAKRLFREAYTIKSNTKDLDNEDAYELKEMIDDHALKALEKYNYENDSFYELLEVLSCTRFACDAVTFGGDFWAHLVFVAELKNRVNSAVHFFAEVSFDYNLVTSCVIIPAIHDSDSLSGNVKRCVVCPAVSPMFHPVGKYIAGYSGSTYADSLYNGKFRAVKSELLPKDDDASRAACRDYYEYLQSLEW